MSSQPKTVKQSFVAAACLLIWELILAGILIMLAHNIQIALKADRLRRDAISTSDRIAILTQEVGLQYLHTTELPVDAPAPPQAVLVEKNEMLRMEFDHMEHLALTDPAVREILTEQRKIFQNAKTHWQKNVYYYRNIEMLQAQGVKPTPMVLGRNFSAHYKSLLQHYKSLKQEQQDTITSSLRSFTTVVATATVSNLLLLLLMFGHTKGTLKDISTMERNFEKYKNKWPLNKDPISNPELAELDEQFRLMIENHERAKLTGAILVDGASDVIFKLGKNGSFEEINAAVWTQWGYRPDELIGKPWKTIVAPESIASMTDFLIDLPGLKQPSALGLTFKRRDGSLCDSRISCYWAAEESCAYCFASDIQEAKKSEDELREREVESRTLMYNLPIGLLLVDDKGKFLSTNREVEKLLGGELLGPDANLDDSFIGAGLHSGGILERGRQERNLMCRVRQPKGEPIPCDITVRTLDQSKNLIVVDDARERIKLESLRQDLIFTLRRNLGEPLAQVRKILQSVQAGSEKIATRISRALLNTDRLLRLIDELLRLEELSPGKLVGQLRPIHVNDLANEALSALSDHALNQGVTLMANIQPAVVKADSERIVQVLINLLSNAIKFSNKGGTVTLSVLIYGDQVEFAVTDNGRGVPAHLEKEIFRAYGQSQSSDAKQGTGLGLAICQSIVEGHNGTIGLRAANPVGSVFWFKLPLAHEYMRGQP